MRYKYIQLAIGKRVRYPILGTEAEPDTPAPEPYEYTIQNSDIPCCYTCTKHYCDADKRMLYCACTGKQVDECQPACHMFELRLQGFGE